MTVEPLVVGCVADQPPHLLEQAFRLLVSWRANAGRYADAPFVLCVAGGVPAAFARQVAPWRPILIPVEPLTPVHPPSNKLRWFQPALEFPAERYVLLDCDVWVAQEPDELLGPEPLRAKLADVATVPDDVFTAVFSAAGLPKPEPSYRLTIYGERSIAYFNAGVLSFSCSAVENLLPRWLHWNQWLEQHLHLLGSHRGFLEQASLSLVVAEAKLQVGLLGTEMNFPAHFDEPVQAVLEGIDPVLIHYHKQTDDRGCFVDSPYSLVQKRIDLAHQSLCAAWRRAAIDATSADRPGTSAQDVGQRQSTECEPGSAGIVQILPGEAGATFVQYVLTKLRRIAASFVHQQHSG